MKLRRSLHHSDAAQLTFLEWLGLLFGREVRESSLKIGLWSLSGDPDA